MPANQKQSRRQATDLHIPPSQPPKITQPDIPPRAHKA